MTASFLCLKIQLRSLTSGLILRKGVRFVYKSEAWRMTKLTVVCFITHYK